MANKPTIVLVHGFWGGAAHWAKVISLLHAQGFDKLYAVENPLTSLADDAERTRKMVQQISGPVVLVGHSYGGKVITEMGDLPNVQALVISPLSRRMRARAPAASAKPTRRKPLPISSPTATAICGWRKTNSSKASAKT